MFRLSRRAHFVAIVSILILCALGGCVRRRLTVRSTPSGARGFVDDHEIGVTPFSTPFTYYGTRRIRLEKDGMKPATVERTIYPPWYQLPVVEFISENLWPWEIRDEREVTVQMEPQPPVQPEALFDRAQALRRNSRMGVAAPMVPVDGPVPETLPLQPRRGLGHGLLRHALPGHGPSRPPQPGAPTRPLFNPYLGPSNPVTPSYRLPNE